MKLHFLIYFIVNDGSNALRFLLLMSLSCSHYFFNLISKERVITYSAFTECDSVKFIHTLNSCSENPLNYETLELLFEISIMTLVFFTKQSKNAAKP